MNLTNESYVVKIKGKSYAEFYYKDNGSWYKVSSHGKKFKATAEQILNHVLPAVAGVKPSLTIEVEHYEDPEARILPEVKD